MSSRIDADTPSQELRDGLAAVALRHADASCQLALSHAVHLDEAGTAEAAADLQHAQFTGFT